MLLNEIADVMFDQGLHEDALRMYETLSADETVRDLLQRKMVHRSFDRTDKQCSNSFSGGSLSSCLGRS